MTRKLDLMFARFPFGNQEAPSVTNWMIETVGKAKAHPNVGRIMHREYDDTPITMTRNRAAADALAERADILFMIDSDMQPDIGLLPGSRLAGARPFFETALEFMLRHPGPCSVGAPYCGPPPWENVYVFQPAKRQNDNPNVDFAVEQFTREEAAGKSGFEQVFALPTGVIAIDVRSFLKLPQPWFDYEWEGDHSKCDTCKQFRPGVRARKASTEDVYFSRNCALVGLPQYVLWDAWAGHWKRKLVTKPSVLTVDRVIEDYKEAILRGNDSRETLLMVGEGKQPKHLGEHADARRDARDDVPDPGPEGGEYAGRLGVHRRVRGGEAVCDLPGQEGRVAPGGPEQAR
jgi:hypothetical protein